MPCLPRHQHATDPLFDVEVRSISGTPDLKSIPSYSAAHDRARLLFDWPTSLGFTRVFNPTNSLVRLGRSECARQRASGGVDSNVRLRRAISRVDVSNRQYPESRWMNNIAE